MSPASHHSYLLTAARQIQVAPAGGQHSGVDARNHVGLIHDEVHHVVIRGQFTLSDGTNTHTQKRAN